LIFGLLKTLEKIPTSVFHKKELLNKSEEQFEKLKAQGFLTYYQPDPDHETYPCAHPCSKACPMDVINMQGKPFAICQEDTEVDPIPLTKDDISRYNLSIEKLIKTIQEENSFTGDNYSFNKYLHFIGENIIEGKKIVFILALFPNIEAAEPHLLSLPSRIPTNYEQIVVITPSLSLTQEPIYAKLKNASMVSVSLTTSFGKQDFKINYKDAVRKNLLPSIRPSELQNTEQVINEEFISLTEAGKLLAKDKGTISRWADDGKIRDNGKKGQKRKVSKASVLILKHEKEEKEQLADFEDFKRDADNVPDMH
jgi:hypothetical protein